MHRRKKEKSWWNYYGVEEFFFFFCVTKFFLLSLYKAIIMLPRLNHIGKLVTSHCIQNFLSRQWHRKIRIYFLSPSLYGLIWGTRGWGSFKATTPTFSHVNPIQNLWLQLEINANITNEFIIIRQNYFAIMTWYPHVQPTTSTWRLTQQH